MDKEKKTGFSQGGALPEGDLLWTPPEQADMPSVSGGPACRQAGQEQGTIPYFGEVPPQSAGDPGGPNAGLTEELEEYIRAQVALQVSKLQLSTLEAVGKGDVLIVSASEALAPAMLANALQRLRMQAARYGIKLLTLPKGLQVEGVGDGNSE
jgi:hypothetical protein